MEVSKLMAISYNDEVDAVSYVIALLTQFHWQKFYVYIRTLLHRGREAGSGWA